VTNTLCRVVSAAVIAAVCLVSPLLHPQDLPENATVASGRKVVNSAPPEYPALLRASRIGGIVKLNVTVLPNGTVSKVSILGGNPVLAEEASKAVKLWKFASAPSTSNEVVFFNFHAK